MHVQLFDALHVQFAPAAQSTVQLPCVQFAVQVDPASQVVLQSPLVQLTVQSPPEGQVVSQSPLVQFTLQLPAPHALVQSPLVHERVHGPDAAHVKPQFMPVQEQLPPDGQAHELDVHVVEGPPPVALTEQATARRVTGKRRAKKRMPSSCTHRAAIVQPPPVHGPVPVPDTAPDTARQPSPVR